MSLRCSDIENRDSNFTGMSKAQQSRKSTIQRDQGASFASTHVEQQIVRNALKILLPDRRYIVTRRPQNLGARNADILVQFEFHAISGSDITVSRAASAP